MPCINAACALKIRLPVNSILPAYLVDMPVDAVHRQNYTLPGVRWSDFVSSNGKIDGKMP